MNALILTIALAASPAGGGAIAWGNPLCLLVRLNPGKPLILGNDCIHGFTPRFDKKEILS
jgi:hypothetical protein